MYQKAGSGQSKTIDMELKELIKGDTIAARYGAEYREMDVLANDSERKQITVNIRFKIGIMDEVKRLEVMDYDSYNLRNWGKINENGTKETENKKDS